MSNIKVYKFQHYSVIENPLYNDNELYTTIVNVENDNLKKYYVYNEDIDVNIEKFKSIFYITYRCRQYNKKYLIIDKLHQHFVDFELKKADSIYIGNSVFNNGEEDIININISPINGIGLKYPVQLYSYINQLGLIYAAPYDNKIEYTHLNLEDLHMIQKRIDWLDILNNATIPDSVENINKMVKDIIYNVDKHGLLVELKITINPNNWVKKSQTDLINIEPYLLSIIAGDECVKYNNKIYKYKDLIKKYKFSESEYIQILYDI